MSATFTCPHCGAVYPVKPVLVNKAVRCTTCKQPFRLGEDGIARPVGSETVSALRTSVPRSGPAEAVAPAPQAPGPAALATAQPQVGSAARPTSTQSGTERRIKSQKSARHDAMQRELSSSLQTALASAIKVEETKAAAEERRNAQRKQDIREGKVGDIGPVQLTGEGERIAREHRWQFTIIALLMIGIVAGCWSLTIKSEQQLAIAAYTDPVSSGENRYGRRAPAITGRAWLAVLGNQRPAPFISLPDARILPVRTMDGKAIAHGLAPLIGRAWVPQIGCWVAKDKVQAAVALQSVGSERLREQALIESIELLDRPGLRASLLSAKLTESDADFIMALMDAQPNAGNDLPALFAGGAVGLDRIELCDFSGKRGLMLFDKGGKYETVDKPYQGTLMRCLGTGWPTGWRVLRLLPMTETH